MSGSLDPIAKNDVWDTLAALQRRLSAIERTAGGGGFIAGDYLDSERTHPDFVAGALSDGDRPGWYLANGATNADMATTDPTLYAILGNSTTLPDYRGRVRVSPDGATFASRGTLIGGTSTSVTLSQANLPPHVHAAGTLTISPNPHSHSYLVPNSTGVQTGGTNLNAGTFAGSTTGTASLTIGGSTGSIGSGTAFSVGSVQPTRTCGVTWIKR